MPRRKSKASPKPLPEEPLKNIINQITQAKPLTNCFVKMQKLNVKVVNDCVKDINNLKRQKTKDANENNEEECPSKRTPEKPSTSRVDDEKVEKMIKKYEILQKVISDRYVTVVRRLNLDFVPLCAENIGHCHRKHYKRAPPPKFLTTTQSNLVRNALQQSRYDIFISLVWNFCQKEQFPGDTVLTSIIKLILTLNPESKHNKFLQPVLDQLLWLFDVILRVFPPCWLALRSSYMKFLRNTIEMSNLLPDKTLHAENTIFEVVLMLLEDMIDDTVNMRPGRSSKRNKDANSSLTHFDDEYHNMQHWEKNDNDEQTFAALSKETRLDRLMQVLHLIAKMLEMDLAMWMLRFHKNPKNHIYSEEDQPLVITLFTLSKYSRSSVLVKKVMTLFAVCVEKNFDEHYIKVMERYISLLANIENLCEIVSTSGGICYPHVGPGTKSFIMEFFKTTESNMKKDVNTYMRVIKSISSPFVRYEYIDLFLRRLNPDPGKMCPQKIVENFRKKRWLECAPAENKQNKTSNSTRQSVIYRQDYLQILFDALRSYCDFHGTKEFLREVQSHASKDPNPQTRSQQTMTKNHFTIDLPEVTKNINHCEGMLNMLVKLREPKMPIPVVNIRVNSELFSLYRNDIKHVMILQAYISALEPSHVENFKALLDYLLDFAPSQ